jgi:molybdate transport system substrate-binding protein
MSMHGLVSLAAVAAVLTPISIRADAEVFAAASLADVVNALQAAFTAETGVAATLAADASSTLARQIEAGAPAGLFISANRQWADYLVANSGYAEPVRFAGNALVVIGPQGAAPLASLAELPAALAGGRLALGDPEHVPAGQYAREALTAAGVWDSLAGSIAPAGNVRAAVLLVETGAAPYAIVYATDAAFPGVAKVLEIDTSLYAPVVYWMTLAPSADADDEFFFDWLQSDAARAILIAQGFTE